MGYYAGKHETKSLREGRHSAFKRFAGIFLSLAVLTSTLYAGVFPAFALGTDELVPACGIEDPEHVHTEDCCAVLGEDEVSSALEDGTVSDVDTPEDDAVNSQAPDDTVSSQVSDVEEDDEESAAVSSDVEMGLEEEDGEVKLQANEILVPYANMNDAEWKQKALEIGLTGNCAADVLAIAKSQVGY